MIRNGAVRLRCYKILVIGIFLICAGFLQAQQLDMKSYLALAKKDTIYPSPQQMTMLKGMVPKHSFQPAPSINDRSYWDAIAKTPSGRKYMEEALSKIDSPPEVPITDEIYRRANKEGNRKIYKPRYYRSMDRLEHFVLAECLENKGRFLPQIEVYIEAILRMKSWLHPNHDDKNNTVLEGKRVSIDLGARKFGSVLSLAEIMLEDTLKEALRLEIKKQLQWRIVDTYLTSCKTNDRNNHWIKSTSNWNSVCTSGSVFVAITTAQNYEERLAAVGSALNSMQYYLSGFGDDGYCSEGLGYWRYGFGHYLYLAQTLYDYTDGRINLFKAHDPQKLKNIGNFPEKFEIQLRKCAPFADGVSNIKKRGSNFAYFLSAKHYGAQKPEELRMEEAVSQLIAWNDMEAFTPSNAVTKTPKELPNHSYFDDAGMVISRGKQKIPFSIAVKAGHNKENHNHSDVGTYIVLLGKDMMTGDIGRPSYVAGAFSPDNKARSSWGHPVPIIDSILQSNGRAFSGQITNTKFSATKDEVIMDVKAAYEIPALQTLERRFINDRKDSGTITVTDTFSTSKPVQFGTTIMTFSNYRILDGKTILFTSENYKMKATITSTSGDFRITDQQVPVEKLGEGERAYRIGIDFIKPLNNAVITVQYEPIIEK